MDGGWERTHDLKSILRLHRLRNPGVYELAGQYSHLRPSDLASASCWIYRQGRNALGHAVAWKRPRSILFDELVCAVTGLADWAVQEWVAADVGRLRRSFALLRRAGAAPGKRVLLRAADDNAFGLLLAKRYALPWESALILAVANVHDVRASPLPRGYSVRPYREGDEARYAAIHAACFNQQADAPGMRDWATAPDCEGFSAMCHDRVVGLFIAEVRRGGRLGDFNSAVEEGHRSLGVGTALLAAGMRSFRRRGVRRVIADHWATNAPAVAFYRKHGFRPERVYHYFSVGQRVRTP